MKILVIDDDKLLSDLLMAFLKNEGYEAARALSAEEGLALTKTFKPDTILLDIRLKDESGLKLLPDLLIEQCGATVIIMTGYPTTEGAVEALSLGAVNYLEKPVDFKKLKEQLEMHQGLLPHLN